MFCQTKLKIYKYENYKNGKNWLRIDSHRSQSLMRFNVFKFFFLKQCMLESSETRRV